MDDFQTSDVAVVLPAKDEELTIKQSILKFHQVLPQANIYVVDNNSKDQTGEIARSVFAQYKISGEVFFEPEDGKSYAVKKALSHVNANYYVLCDADLTYPINDVEKLLIEMISADAQMIIGDRLSNGNYKHSNSRPFHFYGNRLMTCLLNLLFKTNCRDIASGFRIIQRDFLNSLEIKSSGFNIEAELNIHAAIHKLKVIYCPISYVQRPHGSQSKLRTYRDGFNYINFIIWRFFEVHLSKLKHIVVN